MWWEKKKKKMVKNNISILEFREKKKIKERRRGIRRWKWTWMSIFMMKYIKIRNNIVDEGSRQFPVHRKIDSRVLKCRNVYNKNLEISDLSIDSHDYIGSAERSSWGREGEGRFDGMEKYPGWDPPCDFTYDWIAISEHTKPDYCCSIVYEERNIKIRLIIFLLKDARKTISFYFFEVHAIFLNVDEQNFIFFFFFKIHNNAMRDDVLPFYVWKVSSPKFLFLIKWSNAIVFFF